MPIIGSLIGSQMTTPSLDSIFAYSDSVSIYKLSQDINFAFVETADSFNRTRTSLPIG
jgi:hypothetical protein